MPQRASLDELKAATAARPDDDDARAELGHALAADGRTREAAAELFRSAGDARRRDRQDLHRERIAASLKLDPDGPPLFLEPAQEPGPEMTAPTAVGDTEAATILLALGDTAIAAELAAHLRERGYETIDASTKAAADTAIAEHTPDAIICASSFADGDAAGIAREARARRPDTAFLLLTCAARGEVPAAEESLARHVDERLDRPLGRSELADSVARALWRQRHAAAPGGGPAAASPLVRAPRRLARTTLVVAAGYAGILAVHLLLTEVLEARSTAAPSEWTQLAVPQSASAVALSAVRLRPGDVEARGLSTFAAPELTTFELELTNLSLERQARAAIVDSIRLDTGDAVLAPLSLRIDRTLPTPRAMRIWVAFLRADVAGKDQLRLVAAIDGAPLELRLRSVPTG